MPPVKGGLTSVDTPHVLQVSVQGRLLRVLVCSQKPQGLKEETGHLLPLWGPGPDPVLSSVCRKSGRVLSLPRRLEL